MFTVRSREGRYGRKLRRAKMGEVKLKGISSNHVADEQNILFSNALKAINRG